MTKSLKAAEARARVEELEKQLATAKSLILELSWMARRYAHGRMTYAPTEFNLSIDRAILYLGMAGAFMNERASNGEPLYADDGHLGAWDPLTRRFEKEKS